MSLDRAFRDLFNEVATLEPVVGQNAQDQPVFGAPVSIAARIESEVPKETNAPAEQIESYARVFLRPTTITGDAYTIGPLDRITLPPGYVPAAAIVSVARKNDEKGLHHYVLRVLQRASALRRHITLQKPVKTQNPETGEETLGWADVGPMLAIVRPVAGEETFSEAQHQAYGVATFRIDLPADIPTPEWRIRHQGRVFDILDVRDLGQREQLELLGRARAE